MSTSAATQDESLAPYRGLAAFDDSDLDVQFFFGRERERVLITANLMASRLTVLYGETGVGKSSVLRAGVAHHLRALARRNLEEHGEPELAVVVFDSWRDDPVEAFAQAVAESVRHALSASWPEPPLIPGSLADRLRAWTEILDGHLYVIFDQTEEFFLYHEGEEGEGTFADELPELVRLADLRASFLISLREDSLAKLDRFKGRIPNLFSNYLRLEPLDRAAGREAILGPIEQYNRLVADEERVVVEKPLVDAVLGEVTAGKLEIGQGGRGVVKETDESGRIEAPYLQLVMQRLWEAERAAGSHALRLSTLRELGGAEQIVRDHLEGALDSRTPEQRDIAAAVFNQLVTPSGAKIAHAVPDLARYARVAEEELNPVLSALAHERILRPVATADGSDAPHYEIYHDVLADAVLAWKVGHDSGRELERERQEAERKHRRLLLLMAAAAVALAAMAVVVGFALVQRSTARSEARLALARELAANAVTQLATDPQLSILLALEAARREPTAQVEDVLRRALVASRERAVLGGAGGPVATATFSRDGRLVLTASRDGNARVYDVGRRRLLHVLKHDGPVRLARFSPDGGLVVTASADGTARIWRTGSGEELQRFEHDQPVTDTAFGSGGVLVATGGEDGTARIWRVGDAQPLRVLRHPGPVTSVSFDLTDGLVITGSGTTARLWRVDNGRLVRVLEHESPLVAANFSPSGKLVITAGKDYSARIWDAGTGRQLHELIGHVGSLRSASFGPDDALAATSSADGTARVWDVSTGATLATLSPHTSSVNSAAFSADGAKVVTASADFSARVWNVTDGRLLGELLGHTDVVNDALFSPDGRVVVTASADGTARLWDPNVSPLLDVVGTHTEPATAASFSPDGTLVLSAGEDDTARVWTASTGQPMQVLRHDAPVGDAAFSPNGEVIGTAGADGTARIWDAATGAPLRALRHEGPVNTLSFSGDGRRVVTSSEDGAGWIWLAATGRLLHALRHGGPVASARFSPDGRRVLTAGRDGVARLWNAETGAAEQSLRGHGAALTAAEFSRDGSMVVTAGEDDAARIWDARSGSLLHVLRGHTEVVTDAQFSPDGSVVVSASGDRDARIWSVESGALIRILRAHFGLVSGVSFSPDGRWIVTAGPGTGGLWQTAGGRFLFYLVGHKGPLVSATFDRAGKRILTAGRDGTIRIYDCDICGSLDALEALARQRLAQTSRALTPSEREQYLHE